MLITQTNMREYFREALSVALRKKGVEVTETAQAYLVHLLAEFGRADAAFAGVERGESPALATWLTRAQEAEPDEALRIYKHMGDSSLYLTGFFADSVQSAPVPKDYYVSMGGQAYASVAGLMRPSAATTSALFAELSDRFADLVELLCAMSLHGERSVPSGSLPDEKLLTLVERYRRTQNPEILETLRAHGVVLRPGLDGDSEVVQ